MSKYGSSSVAFFLVDGINLISSMFQSFSYGVKLMTQPTKAFGVVGNENRPSGIIEHTLSTDDAFLDDTAAAIHATFKAAGQSSRIVCWTVEGNTTGKHCSMAGTDYVVGYVPFATDGGLTKAKVEHKVSGTIDDGVIVQALAAQTIDWDTTATPADYASDTAQRGVSILSSSVASPSLIITDGPHGWSSNDVVVITGHASVTPDINDAPVAAEAWKAIGHVITVTGTDRFTIPVNVTDGGTGGTAVRVNRTGGVGYIAVTALSGITGFVGKIRHSDDNSSWADLVTFTNITAAPGKERVTYAGAAKRYLSFTGDITGTGSLTVFAGLSRT